MYISRNRLDGILEIEGAISMLQLQQEVLSKLNRKVPTGDVRLLMPLKEAFFLESQFRQNVRGDVSY